MSPSTWAVVVAAGEGRRYGRAKQFESLNGRLVVEWAIEAVRSVAEGVVLVVASSALGDSALHGTADIVVEGGSTRSKSVRAGLAAVPTTAEIVVVHDAARPLASAALCRAVVAAVRSGAAGAVPGLVINDTVKRTRDGRAIETLDRDGLVVVQTPQAFSAPALRAAHAGGRDATDDAALLELIGKSVVVVPGEAANVKITETADMSRVFAVSAEALEAPR